MVYLIQNKEDLTQKISEAGEKLIVLDFHANWCGPCKIVGPKFEELSERYNDQAVMLKIDVDDCEEIALEYNVTVMPTFVFIKNNEVIEFFVGGNAAKLVKHVEKHCGVEASASQAILNVDSSILSGIGNNEQLPPSEETSADFESLDPIEESQVDQ